MESTAISVSVTTFLVNLVTNVGVRVRFQGF